MAIFVRCVVSDILYLKAVEFMTVEAVFYESGNGGVSFSPNKLLPGHSHSARKAVQILLVWPELFLGKYFVYESSLKSYSVTK